MRILHLASSHRWTGAAEPAADLAVAQRELGHETDFACIGGHSFHRRLVKRGIPLVDGFDFRRGIHLLKFPADASRLRSLVASEKYDVVHCHLTHDHWLAASALRLVPGPASNAPRPILVRTLHRDTVPAGDPLHRWLYGRATDLTITVSRASKELVEKRFGLAEGRAAWVRGAVDLERFRPGLNRNRNRDPWKIPRDAPVAGIVARMQAHRGHLEFIETIEDVVRVVPEARYVISGRGEIKNTVRKLIRNHPLTKHLVEVGYRKNDLPEAYASFDVGVLLARGSDGSCRAMLEAMACGRPVIGVRSGAIAETIEHGKTGWLIDFPVQHDQLAAALIEAFKNLDRTAEMGRAARAKMESDFTQLGRAKATLAAYEAAIARSAAEKRR